MLLLIIVLIGFIASNLGTALVCHSFGREKQKAIDEDQISALQNSNKQNEERLAEFSESWRIQKEVADSEISSLKQWISKKESELVAAKTTAATYAPREPKKLTRPTRKH